MDPNTGEPVRDANGLCMTCKPNEPGVFIGKIIPNNPSRAFLGYVDQEASKKKIVYNVFHHGDSAFLSGDILVADEFGNLFFKDRTGDTFRWKVNLKIKDKKINSQNPLYLLLIFSGRKCFHGRSRSCNE